MKHLDLSDSRPNFLYYFAFNVPQIDPVMTDAAFYQTRLSLLQKLSLFGWLYMILP